MHLYNELTEHDIYLITSTVLVPWQESLRRTLVRSCLQQMHDSSHHHLSRYPPHTVIVQGPGGQVNTEVGLLWWGLEGPFASRYVICNGSRLVPRCFDHVLNLQIYLIMQNILRGSQERDRGVFDDL